jgi:hypothetical protein
VRQYYRTQRTQEIKRAYRELTAEPPVVLTSASAPAHGLLLASLRAQLAAACPEGCVLGPDEVIAVGPAGGPPLLLVELAPPGGGPRGGRSTELAGAGARTYWLIDPVWPNVTVLQLEAGGYVESARHEGLVFTAADPFEIALDLRVPV